MVNFCAVCGCCTRTEIVREHLEDTLRICDVSARDLLDFALSILIINSQLSTNSLDIVSRIPLHTVFRGAELAPFN